MWRRGFPSDKPASIAASWQQGSLRPDRPPGAAPSRFKYSPTVGRCPTNATQPSMDRPPGAAPSRRAAPGPTARGSPEQRFAPFPWHLAECEAAAARRREASVPGGGRGLPLPRRPPRPEAPSTPSTASTSIASWVRKLTVPLPRRPPRRSGRGPNRSRPQRAPPPRFPQAPAPAARLGGGGGGPAEAGHYHPILDPTWPDPAWPDPARTRAGGSGAWSTRPYSLRGALLLGGGMWRRGLPSAKPASFAAS